MIIRSILVAALLATPAWAEDTAAPVAPADNADTAASALSVELARPETLTWPNLLETNGRLAAWQEAVIAAEITGQRIETVGADVGSVVHKGDVLAVLSSATIQNDIVQQQATVQSAQAALDEAKSDADRVRSLSAGQLGAISAQQATEYLVTERKAEADLASAVASLASSRLDLDRTKILAPDDGIISSRSAAIGTVVSSGTELFRMIRQSRIEWQAEVPLRFLSRISAGTKVQIPTPLGFSVPGTVRLISPTASETTGRVVVYVALTPPADAPQPKVGMLVTGNFDLGDSPALTVPAGAVSMRDGFSYVFVLQEGVTPAKVTRRRVETGRRMDDRVEILSGLAAADRVVQAGGAFLSEGSVVTVVTGQGG